MARFAMRCATVTDMTTMNISLPAELKTFVDDRVSQGSYGSSSEFIRQLIRAHRETLWLREKVLAAMESGPGPEADEQYFASLYELAEQTANQRAHS